MRSDLENLRGFLGSYFNQDWTSDYPNVSAALADFLKSEEPRIVQLVCNELDIVIRESEIAPLPEDFMLEELWCYYWPEADNMTDVEFLKLARKELGCV